MVLRMERHVPGDAGAGAWTTALSPTRKRFLGRRVTIDRYAAGQVLQPAHGRLRAQVGLTLRPLADRHLEGEVDVKRAAVTGIRPTEFAPAKAGDGPFLPPVTVAGKPVQVGFDAGGLT